MFDQLRKLKRQLQRSKCTLISKYCKNAIKSTNQKLKKLNKFLMFELI